MEIIEKKESNVDLNEKGKIQFGEGSNESKCPVVPLVKMALMPFDYERVKGRIKDGKFDKVDKAVKDSYEAIFTFGSDKDMDEQIIKSFTSPIPIKGIEFKTSFFFDDLGKSTKLQIWQFSVDPDFSGITRNYLGGCSILVVDGFCPKALKQMILGELFDIAPGCRVIFIKRYDKNGCLIDKDEVEKFEEEFPGIIMLDEKEGREALSKKAKSVYIEVMNDAYEKLESKKDVIKSGLDQGEGKFDELLNKVKEHKWKVAGGGLFTFFGLEELWRNALFGGKKTNEKTKDNKHLPKSAPVSEKKNNSAPT